MQADRNMIKRNRLHRRTPRSHWLWSSLKWLGPRAGPFYTTWIVGTVQIALLGVGWYTYKETLVPLYKQAVLEDNVNKLTLDLSSLTKDKERLDGENRSAKVELARSKEELRATAVRARSAQDVATAAAAAADSARRSELAAVLALRDAQSSTNAAEAELAKMAVKQQQAYVEVRGSVFDAIASRVQVCEANRWYKNSKEMDECFIRQPDRSEDALFRLIKTEDATRLNNARERAQKDFSEVVRRSWEAMQKRENDARAAMNSFSGDKQSNEMLQLRMRVSSAADRTAEFPMFTVPQLVRGQLVKALGEDWSSR